MEHALTPAEATAAPPTTATAPEPPRPKPATELTLGEVACLAAVAAVACIGTASLALAQAGRHDGPLAIGLGLAATAVAATVAARRRIDLRVDRVDILLVVGTLAATLFFFLPGFPYAYGDKDPGVYVAHAFAIEREGHVDIPNEITANDLAYDPFHTLFLPGVYEGSSPGTSTSQFYQFYSAITATGLDVAGERGVFHASPLFAALSVVLFVLAARRAAGTLPAVITAALLTTSMMQVWQAKYPSTEILAQLLLSGAILAAVLALDRRWAAGAYLAGFLVTVGFLVRPDGFLYVTLAVALIAAAIAAGRGRDPRLLALGAGLATPLPYAFWNAYHARARYSRVNGVPPWTRLLMLCALLLLAGLAAHLAYRWWQRRRESAGHRPIDLPALWRRYQGPVAGAAVALTTVALVVLWYRARLFGMTTRDSVLAGGEVDDLNVWNLRVLALFVTLPGLALMVAGLGVLIRNRSRLSLYLLLLPGLAVFPVYLLDARISMYLMWWVRRFVPAVLPALILLIALALAWGLTHRFRSRGRRGEMGTWLLRSSAAVLTVALIVTYARQSLPLRGHHELSGSRELAHDLAALAPDAGGVFLFTAYDTEDTDVYNPLRNAATPLWWMHDQVAVRLPADRWSEVTAETDDALRSATLPHPNRWALEQLGSRVPHDTIGRVERYAEVFPDRPIFVVTDQDDLPGYLPVERFAPVEAITVDLVVWTERTIDGTPSRPDEARVLPYGITVWELVDR